MYIMRFPAFFIICGIYFPSTFHFVRFQILGIYELLALGDLKPDIYVNISIWN